MLLYSHIYAICACECSIKHDLCVISVIVKQVPGTFYDSAIECIYRGGKRGLFLVAEMSNNPSC